MNQPANQQPVNRQPGAIEGWNTARRELAVAGLLVLALTAAAWALDGLPAALVVLVACVTVSLFVLRSLIGHGEEPPPPPVSYPDGPTQSFVGFWRTHADMTDATKSLSAWDYLARPRLTNLLAARLSERHGISLAQDPQAARNLLLRKPSRYNLWYWIDPQRPTPPNASALPGIPPAALAALIDRLEQL